MKQNKVLQWYPGHMAKANKQINEQLKLIDIVIEVLDARVPIASRNPDIRKYCRNKKHIILLNKSDLSDPVQNKKWENYLSSQNEADKVLAFKAFDSRMKQLLTKAVFSLNVKQKAQVKCLLCGIPNVGKSAIINTMVGKRKAKIANKPGVTRGQQWLQTEDGIFFLDTPGILWPKFEDPSVGNRLAWIGSIKDTIFEKENMAGDLMNFLLADYPDLIEKRYGISVEGLRTFEVFDAIAESKKLLVKGGEYDYARTSSMILADFRNGRLGRITIDVCPE